MYPRILRVEHLVSWTLYKNYMTFYGTVLFPIIEISGRVMILSQIASTDSNKALRSLYFTGEP